MFSWQHDTAAPFQRLRRGVFYALVVGVIALGAVVAYKFPRRWAKMEQKQQARQQVWEQQVGARPSGVSAAVGRDVLMMLGLSAGGAGLLAAFAWLAIRRRGDAGRHDVAHDAQATSHG